MGGIGATEIILVLAVIILFFGASKIPELARGVGEGLNEFRNASEKHLDSDNNETETTSNKNERRTDKEEVKHS